MPDLDLGRHDSGDLVDSGAGLGCASSACLLQPLQVVQLWGPTQSRFKKSLGESRKGPRKSFHTCLQDSHVLLRVSCYITLLN